MEIVEMMETEFAREVRGLFRSVDFWPRWVGEVSSGRVLIANYQELGIGPIGQVLGASEYSWTYLGPSQDGQDHIWEVINTNGS
jgi:hypothetical protein